MKEFMMIFRNDYTPEFKPSAEQMQAGIKQWQDWMGGIAAQGKFVSTNRLSSVGSKILKQNNLVTDGPYAEVKEIVGGYLIVKADNFDGAMKLAEDCPIFNMNGNVEVREVIPMAM